MKNLFFLLSGLACLLLHLPCFAQAQPIKLQPAQTTLSQPAETAGLFQSLTVNSRSAVVDNRLGRHALLEINEELRTQLLANAPESLQLTLPVGDNHRSGSNALHLNLTRVNPLAPGFVLNTASGQVLDATALGVHYRGSLEGEPDAHVAFSILPNEIQALIARPGGNNEVLGPLPEANELASADHSAYLLYEDGEVFSNQDISCATPDSENPYRPEELELPNTVSRSTGGCVNVYFEVDYDIYQQKGGTANAAAYVTAAFNEVAALYAAINVDIAISELFVWDQPSPYGGSSSSTLLSQFQAYRSAFNGDIAQLLSYQASGGIAVLDGLCHPVTAARMSFSSISHVFNSVPTYSWTIMVITHELGHLLGSQHTHACVWNGNGTAIDGCAGFTEGSCPNPGAPSGGGSIMSYCHITPSGIDFTVGLGAQPGAVIFNNINAATCLSGTSCGGNPPPPPPPPPPVDNNCSVNLAILSVTLDNFGMETTWVIETEEAQPIASGGPYPKKQAGLTITDTICLPDGCYNLRFYDNDGDGLCCEFGNGSFQLRDSLNNVLAIGGEFDSLDVQDFCLPYVEPDDEENTDCLLVNFIDSPVISYGLNQDIGEMVITNEGRELRISNNAWKAVELAYAISPETVMELDFKSTIEGEIHGIGFDEDLGISPAYTFQFYGTQNWGIPDFNTYTNQGIWQHYTIPVGQFLTGESAYLFFAADHDIGERNANSYFRNIRIYEGNNCEESNLPEQQALSNPQDEAFNIWPNPVQNVLHVDVPGSGDYQIMSVTGRVLQSSHFTGKGSNAISIHGIPAGTYLIRYQGVDGEFTKRFTKN